MRLWPGLRLTIAISAPAAAQDSGLTAITDVTVIDGSSPIPRAGQTVLIQGNRIVAVAPTAAIQFPAGTRPVSGAGKFLIPGLWDMHVHTVVPAGRRVLGLYLGLHEELALLARGGMPPHAVLKAATLEPARYLGLTDSLGIIAEGQLAELVLLRENPLADIGNTRTIEGVMSNGRWYDRGRLDRLIGSVPGH